MADVVELVTRCRNGDGKAWETLIKHYSRLIYSIPIKFGFDEATASDIFQSVCLALVENLYKVDAEKLTGWIAKATRSFCINLVQWQKYRVAVSLDDIDVLIDQGDEVREALELQAIRDAVDTLPPNWKAVIRLMYFDEEKRSYEQVSKELNIPKASIGPTCCRSLKRLKALLESQGIEYHARKGKKRRVRVKYKVAYHPVIEHGGRQIS